MPSTHLFDNRRLVSKREIRIFLSSTFVDLDEERSALVKLFNKIKYEVRNRDVYLTIVDLRWGVTEEECKEGKILSVCLNEIENSHPFFVGLLGNRYGYTPSEQDLRTNPELLERYPWLSADVESGLSITEIEMQYGALRQTEETDAAFFIKESSENDDNPRLTELKEKILKQNRYEASKFETVEDLCEKVSRAVYLFIDKYFPETESTLGVNLSQVAYLNDYTHFYVKNQDSYRFLDSFVENDNDRYLVIVGESGIGKTALLSNWIRDRSQSAFSIISYFIGDSVSDNSKQIVLGAVHSQLIAILNEKQPLDDSLPSQESIEKLILRIKNSGQQLVIVIDAINQLIQNDRDTLLEWFPMVPLGVKVVFSTLNNDASLSVFERIGYSVFHLNPLDKNKRNEFIVSYLSSYGKKLSLERKERILYAPLNQNTLVLKTLLDELICYGSYKHLDERIDYYLSANSQVDFFDRVIARLEHDYSANRDVVKTVLTLILLSKEGLSEDEILGITRFRAIDWSLFFCSFYSSLVSRKGLLSFSHKRIAQAVLKRYNLSNPENAQLYRARIIDFFQLNHNSERKTIELAYQYYNQDAYENLYNTVLNYESFKILNEDNPRMLACYWRKLLAQDSKYSLGNYLNLRKGDEPVISLPLYSIASFIGNYFPNAAIEMQYYTCYINSDTNIELFLKESPALAIPIYKGIANCFGRVGKLDLALRVYKVVLEYLTAPSDVSDTLHTIGSLYESKGERKLALDYYQKSISVASDNDLVARAINYIGIAGVYKNQKDYDAALKYYHQALEILETYRGATVAGMGCFLGLGYVYGKLKKKDIAIDYLERGRALLSKEYGDNHPLCFMALQYKASVFLNNDDNANALRVLLSIVDTFEQNNQIKPREWEKVYRDIGELYYRNHEFNNAIEYYNKAIDLARKYVELEPDIAKVYGKLSSVYFEQKQFFKSAETLEKAAEIIDKHEESSENKIHYYKYAGILFRAADRMDMALPCYEKALKSYYVPSLISSTNGELPIYEDPAKDSGISDVYNILEEYPESLERAFLSVIHEIGEPHPFSVFVAYKCIASAFYAKNNYEKALEAVERIIKAFEERYSNNYLPYSYSCSIAGVLNLALKKSEEALNYFQRAFEISKQIGDDTVTAKVYYRMGQVYSFTEDYSRALYYYEQSVAQSKEPPILDAIESIGLVNEILNKQEVAIENYKRVIDLYNGDQWMTSAYLSALSGLGRIYLSRNEDLIAFEYYLRAADTYKEPQSAVFQDDIVNCCRMAATIAVRFAQEASKKKMGYDHCLHLLKDSYQYMQTILGDSDTETKTVYAWIEVIEEAKRNSWPWFKRLFTKK